MPKLVRFLTGERGFTQANGAEIMIWLSHPHVLAGGGRDGQGLRVADFSADS